MSAAGPEAEAASPFAGDRAPLPPRADLVTGGVLAAFGLAVVAQCLRMPTFAEQTGHALTAPGIVPGFHGVVITALGLLLALRAVRRGALAEGRPRGPGLAADDGWRLGLACLLGIVYAVGLIGRLPFWAAAGLFVFAFTTLFEWPRGPVGRPRRIAEALLLGLATGGGVTLLFERIFLVRLP